MTPPMYERLWDKITNSDLMPGFTAQLFSWRDSGDLDEQFIVFRPAGSTPFVQGRATTWHVRIDVVSGINSRQTTTVATQALVDHFHQHAGDDENLGFVTPVNGLPEPIITTEGRLVYTLLFACLYGNDEC